MDPEDYWSSSEFPCHTPEPGLRDCHYSAGEPSRPPYNELPILLPSQLSSGYSSDCSSSGTFINTFNFFFGQPETEKHNHSSQIVSNEPSVIGRGHGGCIPTCHISPRNEGLLKSYAPLLVNDMDATALLPHLIRYGLANREDTDYISNPLRTNQDRNMHIIRTAPYKDSNAFERFVKCLEEVAIGSELASHLRKGMNEKGVSGKKSHSSHQTYAERNSPAQLQQADEVAESQQGYAHEESERMMVLQQFSEPNVEPGSQHSLPSTQLPKVPHEDRSHHIQEVHAGIQHGDSSHHIRKNVMQRELIWLQRNTVFQDCHEEIQFASRTNYGEDRKVLHYSTLYVYYMQHRRAQFVVLLSDFLLVLKLLEPRRRAAEQQRCDDHMFSNNRYIISKLLLLHQCEVQGQDRRQCSFTLHCKHTPPYDLCFDAPSSTAKDVWVEALAAAIDNSCRLQRLGCSRQRLCIENEGMHAPTVASGCGQSLTLSASSLVTVQGSSGYCRRLFYTAILGEHQQCRTLCVERKTNASWKFTFEFHEFVATDTLEIGIRQENNFSPNDLLGVVHVYPGHEMETSFPLKPLGSGEIHFKISTVITNGNPHTDKQ